MSIWNFRVKQSIFCQKWSFLCNLELFNTPRTLNIFWGWLIWAPNLTYKSPLRHRKKNWPPYEILELNGWSLTKKRLFLCQFRGILHPPGPSIFAGMAHMCPKCYLQVPLWDTWKKLTSIWNFRVKRLIFSQKMIIFIPIWGVLHPPGPSIFSGDG